MSSVERSSGVAELRQVASHYYISRCWRSKSYFVKKAIIKCHRRWPRLLFDAPLQPMMHYFAARLRLADMARIEIAVWLLLAAHHRRREWHIIMRRRLGVSSECILIFRRFALIFTRLRASFGIKRYFAGSRQRNNIRISLVLASCAGNHGHSRYLSSLTLSNVCWAYNKWRA